MLMLGANLFQFVRTVDFVQNRFLVDKLILQPSKVFSQCSTITDVASAHAFQLCIVFHSLRIRNRATGLLNLFLAAKAQTQSPRSFVRQQKLSRRLASRLASSGTQSFGISKDGIVGLNDNVRSEMSLHLGSQLVVLDIKICGGRSNDGI